MGLPKSCLEVGIDESQFEGLSSTGVDDHQYGPAAPSREVGDFLLARAFLTASLKPADLTPIVQGCMAKDGEMDPSHGELCWQRREGNIDGGSIGSFRVAARE